VPDLLAEDNIALESAVGMETPANFLDKKKYSLHPRAGGTTRCRRMRTTQCTLIRWMDQHLRKTWAKSNRRSAKPC